MTEKVVRVLAILLATTFIVCSAVLLIAATVAAIVELFALQELL